MRAVSALLVSALVLALPFASQAIPTDQGKIVQGPYTPTGRSSTAGVVVSYVGGNVHITNHGRILGKVGRRVISRGQLLQSSVVKVRGTVRTVKVRQRKNTFVAAAVVRIADGAVFHGNLSGLADRSQRLSRFFRGKISGNKRSNFLLRSR